MAETSDNINLWPLFTTVLASFVPKKLTISRRTPRWMRIFKKKPNAIVIWALVCVTYFAMAGGIIYDVLNKPPAIGQTRDPYNPDIVRTQFIFPRMNAQYRNEGFTASGLFILGGLGIMILFVASSARLPAALEGKRPFFVAFGPILTYGVFAAVRAMYRKKFATYMK
ncbi:Oligosaccharyl transferase complex subunit OST3/OST6 [Carpediemonas membranifera]|uniref:Oligosaccharyl transferase complex subunit OST3/OST6 n=1 Tax=Carpediemonas membranifera TaxID=201153 RepID=A0A8J6B342_9EUKA|nr:Oligosaccharyl transferase complex subunit OST3/OST6 [Carpediemonas membranifera]|eukprot:KAG9397320.1 Oligosaccharyl transferase complex subunit OST3/OST6 [Carpediemonas membranifera]